MSTPINRDLLRTIPLFEAMAEDALDAIASAATCRRYALGEAVFVQGQRADRFFVLIHGRLKVTQVTADGQQIIVRMVNPGDLFGFAKALRRTDYPGTATAATDSLALCWPTEHWDDFIARHPTLTINAMQAIGGRLQEAHTRIREMATEAVERRVAHAVLRLASQSGRKEAGGIRIDFPISRHDIAEMTGTTLHTVSRILSAWERAGLVDGGRQKLLVRAPHRLVLIADGEEPGHL